jgi:DNA-binding transcriptional regulator PaaX
MRAPNERQEKLLVYVRDHPESVIGDIRLRSGSYGSESAVRQALTRMVKGGWLIYDKELGYSVTLAATEYFHAKQVVPES